MKRETSNRDCLKVSKKNLPHGCLDNLATFYKWLSGESKERKTTTLQETQAVQVF